MVLTPIFVAMYKAGAAWSEFVKLHGYHQEFYLHKYKPNPFWSAEENKRFRHLGNLERFGKWRPPGPFKTTNYRFSHTREQFQYKDRPIPKDHMQRVEEWRWKVSSRMRPIRMFFYGAVSGIAVYTAIHLVLMVVSPKKKTEHH